MSDSPYESLRVTAHLRTPVICDEWLPLDGIVFYQQMRGIYGAETMTVPGGGGGGPKADFHLPFKIHFGGRPDWFFACSFAQPRRWWIAEGADHWNKRVDQSLCHLVDYGGRRGVINTLQGQYKAYHMPVRYRAALAINWYCRGNAARLRELLACCTHIGKKAAQGWGRVSQWDVEPWEHDWSVFRDGRLTRAVPISWERAPRDGRRAYYGIRPSYYRRANRREVVLPE